MTARVELLIYQRVIFIYVPVPVIFPISLPIFPPGPGGAGPRSEVQALKKELAAAAQAWMEQIFHR